MKKQDLFAVSKVETNDTLRELSRERGELFARIAINSSNGEDGLTDAQKALLEKLSDEEKEITFKGQLTREISNVFRVSSFVDGLDNLSEDELTDDEQDEYIKELETLLKGDGKKHKKFIFTYFTFPVEELLSGTNYDGTTVLYTENANGDVRAVRQRNNLYFGFFDDDEEAFNFMKSRLISDIEDETLLLSNPQDKNSTKEEKEESKSGRKLRLK